jgi:DNA topoisomerase-3
VLLIKAPDSFELLIKERPQRKAKSKKRAATKKAMRKAAADDPAIDALKKWRVAQAKKEGVPAFRVLTDKALLEIANDRPANNEELLQVSGVGPRAVTRYGAGILKVLERV